MNCCVFSGFWNSIFYIDSSENLALLEFVTPEYFSNFWMSFLYTNDQKEYIEKENEFDVEDHEEEFDPEELNSHPRISRHMIIHRDF